MADKKRMAKQPMLYIKQPHFKPAEVSMQSTFRSKRSSSPAPSVSSKGSLYEKELRLRNQSQERYMEEKTVEAKADTEEKPPSKKTTARERRQRFHELSLEEKVYYFLQLSPHVPKMKCEVATKDQQVRGYITDYVDGKVRMKTFQRPFQAEITFSEIEDIRLMGF
ncbi:hypothetical protein EQV77_10755 [Halobacillus fulvus]|nr:hypothetical protein EQV77_10755 [Halobacillus fulvus]